MWGSCICLKDFVIDTMIKFTVVERRMFVMNNLKISKSDFVFTHGMPYEKIEQVTESTLVLGVDIGSSEHYVRAFDYRGES